MATLHTPKAGVGSIAITIPRGAQTLNGRANQGPHQGTRMETGVP